ncbi:class Ib ribonucleoside-diphosphate reductase assembly flavoprotein NrdI [Lactococcus insecticola]|uniref:Ribonucleotide reductase assembly protein NrdI n=1 Tax=Pseudolactococcus insecticola TaxID=2709158 RepID=A0A6A0B3Y2_9LACT|nr:class Ib ribonucleoside-diphosphate reductase assembly flavoprotein NrdI [Lactococcus insecticola]GFH40030.1 ribonucleotide reductase assembly protein NrdI [Lactococcus insecticola]
MKIAYYSITRQVERFVKKLDHPFFNILQADELLNDDNFILIIPTYEQEMLQEVWEFMSDYGKQCLGVIGSGNRNFADEFIYSANDISRDFHVPLLYAFEFSGTDADVKTVKRIIENVS